MKILNWIGEKAVVVLCVVLFILFLPFLLLYFLYKLIIMPVDYFKYKHSRYQQDFPRKYRWLSTPHVDNDPYTAIKENDLPVDYIKWREDYDLNGYFIYKNTLLDFNEPLFFDKKKGLWLSWIGQENEDDERDEAEDIEADDSDYENTDDCLSVDETKAYIIEEFSKNLPDRKCNDVVFFYSKKNLEKLYEEGGLEAMRGLDGFVIYEKDELAKAISDFIRSK